MSVVPVKPLEKLQWFENRISPWNTNHTILGVATAAVTDLQTKCASARAAFDAHVAAQSAAEAATLAYQNAIAAMSVAGMGLLDTIRVTGRTTGNPNVYSLAQIPAPAVPTPVGPPGVPFQLKVALKPNGSADLKWKCTNPKNCTNVIYQLYRKVELTAEFNYIGGAGSREFVDTTVPSGVPSVIYSIQATRSTAVGDAAEFIVNFGTAGSTPVVTASAAAAPSGQPAKIAA